MPNRYSRPVATDVQQTYVSQYVPTPFAEFQQNLERKEKKYDETAMMVAATEQDAKNRVAFGDADNAYVEGKRKGIESFVSSVSSKDLSNADVAKTVYDSIGAFSGDETLGKIQKNYAQYQEGMTAKKEAMKDKNFNAANWYVAFDKPAMEYSKVGAVGGKDFKFGGANPSVDARADAAEYISTLQPDQIEQMKVMGQGLRSAAYSSTTAGISKGKISKFIEPLRGSWLSSAAGRQKMNEYIMENDRPGMTPKQHQALIEKAEAHSANFFYHVAMSGSYSRTSDNKAQAFNDIQGFDRQIAAEGRQDKRELDREARQDAREETKAERQAWREELARKRLALDEAKAAGKIGKNGEAMSDGYALSAEDNPYARNWQEPDVSSNFMLTGGSGAAGGAMIGGAAGTVFPVVGNAVGATAGAVIGGASALTLEAVTFSGRKEQAAKAREQAIQTDFAPNADFRSSVFGTKVTPQAAYQATGGMKYQIGMNLRPEKEEVLTADARKHGNYFVSNGPSVIPGVSSNGNITEDLQKIVDNYNAKVTEDKDKKTLQELVAEDKVEMRHYAILPGHPRVKVVTIKGMAGQAYMDASDQIPADELGEAHMMSYQEAAKATTGTVRVNKTGLGKPNATLHYIPENDEKNGIGYWSDAEYRSKTGKTREEVREKVKEADIELNYYAAQKYHAYEVQAAIIKSGKKLTLEQKAEVEKIDNMYKEAQAKKVKLEAKVSPFVVVPD